MSVREGGRIWRVVSPPPVEEGLGGERVIRSGDGKVLGGGLGWERRSVAGGISEQVTPEISFLDPGNLGPEGSSNCGFHSSIFLYLCLSESGWVRILG